MQEEKNEKLGFLTVVEDQKSGLFGGYLVLNSAGRPLEFHCTAPVKPTRAQEILYGPTLKSYLYGEQIGKTLLDHASAVPAVVFTDRPPVVAVSEQVDVPVVLLLDHEESATNSPAQGGSWPSNQGNLCTEGAAPGVPACSTLQVGQNRLSVIGKDGQEPDREFTEQLRGLVDAFDLAEPFERICAAIEEARSAAA